MPLPNPTLDNRRFDQLVAEGRALMPRLAPQLTDHNASDPWITLAELGAWLTEQNIYRFDRLSDEAIRAFVRLVGIEPRMPGVAHAVVSLANRNANGVALVPRIQVATPDAPLFETTEPVFVSPANLVRVFAGRPPLTDATAANIARSDFAPFGPRRPRPGHALYLGFDRALDAADQTLALHVWTPRAAQGSANFARAQDARSDWRDDESVRARLVEEYAASAHRQPHCPPPPDWRLHYRVRTVWEFYAGNGVWSPLADVVDETRALTLTGFVRFKAPVDHQAGGAGSEFYIRCRIVRGRFECPPRLRHLAFNAVTCEHALTMPERELKQPSFGYAHAVFELGEAPVVWDSVRLRLDNGSGQVQTDWRPVPDFDRAGAHDRVFIVNPERGEVQSGDGLRARILPAGKIYAAFRVGSGVGGNIEAERLARIPLNAANVALVPAIGMLATELQVFQPFGATGGSPRELLASAQGRAFARVNGVDKAVTLEDIETAALATPGVPVARVRAIASRDPQLPCYPAPGMISLIVIPPCPRPAPLPSRALLDVVEHYLEPRRLITSEIRAVAPRYRRIGVEAVLHLTCDADIAEVVRAARARLDAFLDPLTGGPDQGGWPFGRTVYRAEVMALLAATPGVARVTALSLRAGGVCCGAGGRCDNIELCEHELVIPGKHRLTTQSEISPNLNRSDAHECRSDGRGDAAP